MIHPLRLGETVSRVRPPNANTTIPFKMEETAVRKFPTDRRKLQNKESMQRSRCPMLNDTTLILRTQSGAQRRRRQERTDMQRGAVGDPLSAPKRTTSMPKYCTTQHRRPSEQFPAFPCNSQMPTTKSGLFNMPTLTGSFQLLVKHNYQNAQSTDYYHIVASSSLLRILIH